MKQGSRPAFDPAIPEKAMTRIRAMVRGNGEDPEKVRLIDADGEILRFDAQTMLTLTPETSERTAPGKQGKGKIFNSRDDARKAINQDMADLEKDPDIQHQAEHFLKERDDKGYGLQKTKIALPFLKKDYVAQEKCDFCSGAGATACKTCNGTCRAPCHKCHGRREIPCPTCRGQRTVTGPGGQRQNCTRCHGRGVIGCTMCQKTGKVKCPVCKGSGRASCHVCHGAGWQSYMIHLDVVASASFDFDRAAVPPEIARIVETLGPKLILQGHGRLEELPRQTSPEATPGKIRIFYRVSLPCGVMRFSIREKPQTGQLFGYRGKLTDVPDFMDGLLREGCRRLHEAAEGKGEVAEKLRQATKYRALAEAIHAASGNSPRKAMLIMRGNYPTGLSDALLAQMLRDSDTAMQSITKRPRLYGLAAALVLNAVQYGVYFDGPLREIIGQRLSNPAAIDLMDVVMLATGCALLYGTLAAVAARATRKALGKPSGRNGKSLSGRAGNLLWYGLGGSTALWFAAIAAAPSFKPDNAPEWFGHLVSMTGAE